MPFTSMGICLIDDGQKRGQIPTMQNWRTKLADEIARQGREMKEVSLAAGLGETFVRDALKRGRGGKVENLRKVSVALGYPPDWLLSDDPPVGGAAPMAHRVEIGAFAPEITPGADLVGARDLPIFASAMGGNGQLVVDFNPIEYVKRPSILEGVKGAYGVRVVGESMEPAYWQGDLALVHPHLPPERDTDVILFDAPPDGPTEAAIKRLTGYSGTEWRLRQYNPPKDWPELRVDWPVCHRVVGKYARR